MKSYYVEWELDGEVHEKTLDAIDPGNAFAKILARYPGAKLRRCIIAGHLAGKIHFPIVQIEYDPPGTSRPEPLETGGVAREQATFGFMEAL